MTLADLCLIVILEEDPAARSLALPALSPALSPALNTLGDCGVSVGSSFWLVPLTCSDKEVSSLSSSFSNKGSARGVSGDISIGDDEMAVGVKTLSSSLISRIWFGIDNVGTAPGLPSSAIDFFASSLSLSTST
jgi:hypothetical protein